MKVNFKSLLSSAQKAASKNAPAIFATLGVVSCGVAIVQAYKAGPKVDRLINQRKAELSIDESEKLPVGEIVKTTWKEVLPIAIEFGTGAAFIFGSHHISNSRNAALMTAYKLSETALVEYKNKVVETLGEKKNKEIEDSIAQDRVTKLPPVETEIINTGKGNTLIKEPITGRYLRSNPEYVKKLRNDLNYRMGCGSEMYVEFDEFLYPLGIKDADVGRMLGWSQFITGPIDFRYSSTVAEIGGMEEPCLVITYSVEPVANFKGDY